MNPFNPSHKKLAFGANQKRLDGIDMSKTHNRLLVLLETIGLFGPITIAKLEDLLPMSRASIWRTTAALREFGWARMRLSDSALELTFKLDDFAANSTFAPKEVDEFAPIIEAAVQSGDFYIDFACIDRLGFCRLVESSRRQEHQTDEVSLMYDDLARAALAALAETEATRHIRHFFQNSSAYDSEVFEFDTYQYALDIVRKNQVLWGEKQNYFCLPLTSENGTGCALKVSIKANKRDGKNRLKLMLEKLNDLLETQYRQTSSHLIQQAPFLANEDTSR